MKLQFLKADCLESLKNNLPDNLDLYNNKDNKWIYEFFGSTSPFLDYKKEVPDFKLKWTRKGHKKQILKML